ncbi:16S rRNA (cytidine(1402)-2'-O)-methyltransferase [Bdellovibrio bacteriovorus]|uniref:Putative methyltransferases n=1 Tax=Bdellovibrio bacteriovorus (strain ATCC 15356 / DSM 50701 / NCIMB 9529 / HD100) TaxID=264462 RepID=Q6MIP4_BDEBA|nr:16S rRNA (cytidine(1402)-2'-O)-methyltransferase [Bdellovibrio bacteriovorus]AHZ83499.1 methyltransferase [Bdellovibrio bacteriovorus]BEV69469.1 Ribosomal RNA small subunit methyltransferase I [Bdellovibrio bacteriovorus]CAE80869.1 putative methyltransferases [Bdellovibrio bacteriovorus HD100]
MLYVVATPIGDVSEISLRALEILKNCDVVICESTKEASKLLRAHGITGKSYEVLDEHSTPEDKAALVPLCAEKTVALVSDCGTPGFCDPGADLVRLCRQKNVPVKSVLGASALMGLLSLSGQRIDEFVFRGFLPAENEARARALKDLTKEKRAIILMDTPYRLKKTLNDMKEHFAQRRFLLTMNLSQEEEIVLEGPIDKLIGGLKADKAEFMLLVYPV